MGDLTYNKWRESRQRIFKNGKPCSECGAYFEKSTFCHLAWCHRNPLAGQTEDCWHPVGSIMPVSEIEEGILVKVGNGYEFKGCSGKSFLQLQYKGGA